MPRRTEKQRVQDQLMQVQERIRAKKAELAKLEAKKRELIAKQNKLH